MNVDTFNKTLEDYKRLIGFRNLGVKIVIDDMELPDIELKKRFCFEDCRDENPPYSYMGDYIEDINGKLLEIRLYRVYTKDTRHF